ncbi:MAG TPA: SPOR domain-containing protein, partial [Caulobacteraceae bacterium]|nr:SPOR domain-containing protein [Caulobacteraceae bacterium]
EPPEPAVPEPAEPAVLEPTPEPTEPSIPTPEADIEPPAPAPAPETKESVVAPQPPPEQTPPPPAGPFFAAQIGAFEFRADAEAAWAALAANRPVLVEGLRFDIQPVRVKGQDWLRGLVRDFATRKDAAAFCMALAGTEYGCILRKLAD